MAEQTILEFETDLFGLKGNKDGALKIPKEHYELTTERFKIRKQGVISKTLSDIELYKIKDITVKQKLTDKARNVGDIEILSSDESDPQYVLKKVKNPHDIREQIRNAAKASRKAEGVAFRSDV